MIPLAVVMVVVIATGLVLWRLLRRQTPHPIDERRTVDFEELRAMWPHDSGGIE